MAAPGVSAFRSLNPVAPPSSCAIAVCHCGFLPLRVSSGLLMRILITEFTGCLINPEISHLKMLHLVCTAKTFCPTSVTFKVPEGSNLDTPFGGYNSAQLSCSFWFLVPLESRKELHFASMTLLVCKGTRTCVWWNVRGMTNFQSIFKNFGSVSLLLLEKHYTEQKKNDSLPYL